MSSWGNCGHSAEASLGLSILLLERGGFCSQASVRMDEKTHTLPQQTPQFSTPQGAGHQCPPEGPPALPLISSSSLRVFFPDISASGSPWGHPLFSHRLTLPSHRGHPWTPGFDTENKLHREFPGGPVVSAPLQGARV